MKWLWWLRRNPGIDWRGRWRMLVGRDPDPTRCVPPDVDPTGAVRALDLVVQAFGVPDTQRYCLRPEDELLALYESVTPSGWPDCLEFLTLYLLVERAIGRPLAEVETAALRSIGDVQRLVAAGRPCPWPTNANKNESSGSG